MRDVLEDVNLRGEDFFKQMDCFSTEIGVADICFSILLFRIHANGSATGWPLCDGGTEADVLVSNLSAFGWIR